MESSSRPGPAADSSRWVRRCAMLAIAALIAAACSNVEDPLARPDVSQTVELESTEGADPFEDDVLHDQGAVAETEVLERPAEPSAPGTEQDPAPAPAPADQGSSTGSPQQEGPPQQAPDQGQQESPSAPAQPATGGPEDRTGVTDDELRIGIIGNFPSDMPQTSDLLKAFRAAFAEVNAQGGVHGRQLVPLFESTGGTVEGGVDAARKLADHVLFACECQGTDHAVAAGQEMDRRGVPHFMTTATEQLLPRFEHAFIIHPLTEDLVRRPLEYMANVLGQKGKKVGMIRTNIKIWEPGDAVFKEHAAQLGMEVGPIRITELTQPSFVSELVAMRNAGVETIFCFCSLEMSGVVRDARSIGYDPVFSESTFTFDIFAQATPGILNGIRGVRIYGTSNIQPEYNRYVQTVQKHYPGPVHSNGLAFWGDAHMMIEAARRAGPDPTREGLKASMATLENFETGGAIPPITFGPNNRLGTRALLPVVCCNSRHEWQAEAPRYFSRFE